jgi:hypothetical protein
MPENTDEAWAEECRQAKPIARKCKAISSLPAPGDASSARFTSACVGMTGRVAMGG